MDGDSATAGGFRSKSSDWTPAEGDIAPTKDEPSAVEQNEDASEAPDDEEEMKPDLPPAEGSNSRITGRCLCKLSILVYLVGCVLISALYVAIYGPAQAKLRTGEAWIPGKPTTPLPDEDKFHDYPYTEWISQRWTYFTAPAEQDFPAWPSLPPELDEIVDVAHGMISDRSGVWFLTNSELFFALTLSGGDAMDVMFLNVSATLGLEVEGEGGRLAVDGSNKVYLVTPSNVTLLDCSPGIKKYCDVVGTNEEELNFGQVYSTIVSLTSDCLWVASESGLFAVTLETEIKTDFTAEGETWIEITKELVTTNISEVIGPAKSLAWRSAVSDGKSQKDDERRALFFKTDATNSPQKTIAFSNSHSVFCSYSFLQRSCSDRQWNSPEEPFGLLVVGTEERLYFFDGLVWWFEWVSVWSRGLGGAIDGVPTAMTFTPTGELFISNNISITRVNVNYTFDRIGPLDGLPYNHINALHFSSYTPVNPAPMQTKAPRSFLTPVGSLWIGTDKGYALFNLASSKFEGYFFGPRWHPGAKVREICSGSVNATVLLTDGGIAVVHPLEMTLHQKALHYQRMLGRHTRDPGLVADCSLTDYDPTTCSPHTTDNDGLWTSWLVASEALRYAVTHDPSARDNAWALFSGMKFLLNVTGVDGLMARSVVKNNVTVVDGVWHESDSIPGWKWKGDTSSDEVVGHMFAYPLVHDLVADSDEEKQSVREAVDSIVRYIKDNGYYLIDVTNQSTRWGVWAPSQLNLNQSWADEHGLNSLQILAYLLSAHSITGKEEYFAAWKDLLMGQYNGTFAHYGLNMINQKITFPRDDNFSDDELAFLPYFLYYFSLSSKDTSAAMKSFLKDRGSEEVDYARLSLERTWRVVSRGKSSAWTAIYAFATGRTSDKTLVEQLVWCLRTWPLELVQWQTTNSHRLDIRHDPEQDRDLHSNTQSVRVLPANERTQLRWNGNPFQLDWNGDSSEMDPGPWLLPYWLARWTQML